VQVGPVDGAVNVSNSTTRFSWNVYPGGAASYQLEVSDSSNFGRLLIILRCQVQISLPAEVLSGATTYYWRINATLTNGIKLIGRQHGALTTWVSRCYWKLGSKALTNGYRLDVKKRIVT